MIISSTPSSSEVRTNYTQFDGKGRPTHALTTDDIGEPTEEQLTDESANRGRDLDTQVLVFVELLVVAIDVAQHNRSNVDSKDVVGIGEETDTSNKADLHMEPSKDDS
jgi:hypothetical protein